MSIILDWFEKKTQSYTNWISIAKGIYSQRHTDKEKHVQKQYFRFNLHKTIQKKLLGNKLCVNCEFKNCTLIFMLRNQSNVLFFGFTK